MKKFKKNKFPKTSSVSHSENSLGEYESISDNEDSDGVLDNMTEESEESSEEEVLALHSGSDSDSSEDELDREDDVSEDDDGDNENNISDSDFDQPNDDLPDSKAWGKKKRLFYNADHITDKIDYLNEEDELAAKMEEEEAKTIQKRMISEIDAADLSLDLLSDAIAERKNDRHLDEKEKIVMNLSQMNQQEKLKLLKKESPKFLTSIEDYKTRMKFLQDDLLPVMKHLTGNQLKNSSAGKFLRIYSQVIMNFCTNISFYILLKSRRGDAESHPIHDWISHYQRMLLKMEPIYESRIKPQIELIRSGDFNLEKTSRKNRKKKSTLLENADIEMESDRENVNGDVILKDQSNNSMSVDNELVPFSDDEDDGGKRPITYQIAKNKGLTPHRKKELRNPRVKHRMKYRKAKIRRKGQVREVRKELQKYSGEISGIKASVIKSVKLKN